MNLLKYITDKDICGSIEMSKANPRIAVRAILLDETGKMALLYMGKSDFYTVPGGGVENNESLEDALKREVLEETGCRFEIVYELGYISENRALQDFTQISYYYIVKVIGQKGLPQMTINEIEQQTHVQWHTPKEALSIILNENPKTNQQKYIQYRDTVVLKATIKYLKSQNPFLEIPLDVYEKHMSLDTVQQLQILNNMMKNQLNSYEVNSILILGIAGGNGLEHIDIKKTDKTYGVDINEKYLEACRQRYPELNGHFETICVDLTDKDIEIPKAKLVIANLIVEYIGYDTFTHHMKVMSPKFISVIIQLNEQEDFVSESPYIHYFDRVSEVHHQMEEIELCNSLSKIGYSKFYREEIPLPNRKRFVQLDFMKL